MINFPKSEKHTKTNSTQEWVEFIEFALFRSDFNGSFIKFHNIRIFSSNFVEFSQQNKYFKKAIFRSSIFIFSSSAGIGYTFTIYSQIFSKPLHQLISALACYWYVNRLCFWRNSANSMNSTHSWVEPVFSVIFPSLFSKTLPRSIVQATGFQSKPSVPL